MSKSEVYSWRVDPELKLALEIAAREKNTSVGAVIEKACRDLLDKVQPSETAAKEQARLRKALMKVAGSIDGPGVSATNENVRKAFQLKGLHDALRRRAPPSR